MIMIMLTEIRVINSQEETVRLLVHMHDIQQVYEKHTKRDTKTYAVIRSPNGSSSIIEIRETIADVHRLVREENFVTSYRSFSTVPTAPVPGYQTNKLKTETTQSPPHHEMYF
jgi:hypothetical protein